MKQKILNLVKDILNPLLLVIILVYLYNLASKESENYTIHKPSKVIERIEQKETEIRTIQNRIDNSQNIVKNITDEINKLRGELDRVKSIKDTVQIIQIQDTLINTLTLKNNKLENISLSKDTIIVTQRYIINSKDTIIINQKIDIKKLKRQRNLSLLANAILGTLIIIK
jgi:hypothetical protein